MSRGLPLLQQQRRSTSGSALSPAEGAMQSWPVLGPGMPYLSTTADAVAKSSSVLMSGH